MANLSSPRLPVSGISLIILFLSESLEFLCRQSVHDFNYSFVSKGRN